MKKILLVIVFGVILLSISACVNEEKTRDNQDNKEKEFSKVDNIYEVNKRKNHLLSVIPKGWTILKKTKDDGELVEGDLNKDGINDIALIIEKDTEIEQEESRALLIAFGNSNKTFDISIIAEKGILNENEGGVWGDPWQSIVIDRGSVVFTHYGGSNFRWYSTHRVRHQNNDWYLIGVTKGSYYTGTTIRENADEIDINLLTGDYIEKKSDENGKLISIKGNRGVRELVRLKDFDIRAEQAQY